MSEKLTEETKQHDIDLHLEKKTELKLLLTNQLTNSI